MSTPETNTSTATPESPVNNIENKSTPVSPVDKVKTDLEILDDTNSLCNTVLYVLTKGFYPGADAHLVNQSKEFVKAIKQDIESRRKSVVNGQAVPKV